MKKNDLKTIHWIVKKNSDSLLEYLENYIDIEKLKDDDLIELECEDEILISGAFFELYDAARKFQQASGKEIKFLADIEKTSKSLTECVRKCEELDLRLGLAAEEVTDLRKKLNKI